MRASWSIALSHHLVFRHLGIMTSLDVGSDCLPVLAKCENRDNTTPTGRWCVAKSTVISRKSGIVLDRTGDLLVRIENDTALTVCHIPARSSPARIEMPHTFKYPYTEQVFFARLGARSVAPQRRAYARRAARRRVQWERYVHNVLAVPTGRKSVPARAKRRRTRTRIALLTVHNSSSCFLCP